MFYCRSYVDRNLPLFLSIKIGHNIEGHFTTGKPQRTIWAERLLQLIVLCYALLNEHYFENALFFSIKCSTVEVLHEICLSYRRVHFYDTQCFCQYSDKPISFIWYKLWTSFLKYNWIEHEQYFWEYFEYWPWIFRVPPFTADKRISQDDVVAARKMITRNPYIH